MGALAAKIGAELSDFKREAELIFVFYDITSERYGVVKPESLTGRIGGFGCFDDFVDLFLGVATGFS